MRSIPNGEYFEKKIDENYRTLQNNYADNIEERLKNNIKYEIKEQENGAVRLKIYPWYYENYASDLDRISVKLLEYSNIEINEKNANTKETAYYYYIASVKAMEILDNYLNNYDNDGTDYVIYDLTFKNEKIEKDGYYSLYKNILGSTSTKNYYATKEGIKLQETRIKEYINNAIKDKTLNTKKPFELKK